VISSDESELRRAIFRRALPLFGRIASPSRLREKDPNTGQQLHPLIEGIYKPRWSRHAVSITSTLTSPYSDQINYLPDRSWWIYYSPKAGDLAISSNRALFQCMEDAEPILVFRQETAKTSRTGSSYRILGLGLITEFDQQKHLFKIRGLHFEEIETYLAGSRIPAERIPDELLETALRLESLERWAPFVQEDRAVYQVNSIKRSEAFRRIVLENFQNTCAVTAQKFAYHEVVEAEAAHIIGKEVAGTDDPRNGLALCRSIHWAFDNGLFTLSDQYEVQIHPQAFEADHKLFPLIQRDGEPIQLPADNYYWPHPQALEWHRKERFGRFAR
jgi:hypothetical protein